MVLAKLPASTVEQMMNISTAENATMLPGTERMLSGGAGEPAVALRDLSSSTGSAPVVCVTFPNRKAEPSSAKLRFQKSTASWTSGSRASFSAETITTVGTTVQAPVGYPGYTTGRPSLSSDGTTLYFYSDRPGGFGRRDSNVTTRSKLHAG